MRHFNVRSHTPAFSLIETVVALLVVGIILTSVFVLENTLIVGDTTLSGRLNRVFALKNISNDPAFEEHDFKKGGYTKEVKFPPMQVRASATAWQLRTQPKLKGLERIVLTGIWQDFSWQDDENLVQLRFVPERDKDRT